VLAALALDLCATANSQQAATAQPVSRQILVMSDLHFDPMADPRLVDQLAAAEPDQWRTVLDSSSDHSLGRYGWDSNWMLLRSALQHMAATLPKPAFVLISGDFLAHGFRREFDAAAKDHSDAAYRAFVRKTMQFLGQQLEQTFPATPIFPALGNNDEECGDYQLQPGGPFLADTLPILRRLVVGASDRRSTVTGRATAITPLAPTSSECCRPIPISCRSIIVTPAGQPQTGIRGGQRSPGLKPSSLRRERPRSGSGFYIISRRVSTATRRCVRGLARVR
jgi:hypothetical protein